ncbi:hypothetical protein CHS0354_032090 [Potamilus streckersoni]|uniref:Uncharacterized protein n=1 Tax=Potamilus streckersoni TaxID=2493646 RepID=A0AAE0TLA4_9BIVA|nr:hypothetical protein CHS0354_032090 [Potamilus streckersoni]
MATNNQTRAKPSKISNLFGTVSLGQPSSGSQTRFENNSKNHTLLKEPLSQNNNATVVSNIHFGLPSVASMEVTSYNFVINGLEIYLTVTSDACIPVTEVIVANFKAPGGKYV